jgi:hypothetical protein
VSRSGTSKSAYSNSAQNGSIADGASWSSGAVLRRRQLCNMELGARFKLRVHQADGVIEVFSAAWQKEN